MAGIKTKSTKASVAAFLAKIEPKERRAECVRLRRMMEKVTGKRAVLWGDSLVGFGSYHYTSERSAQEGDWPLVAFSPRKATLTVYIMPGFSKYATLLKKLGPHTKSVSCLYLKRLSDIDETVLERIVTDAVVVMRKRYPST